MRKILFIGLLFSCFAGSAQPWKPRIGDYKIIGNQLITGKLQIPLSVKSADTTNYKVLVYKPSDSSFNEMYWPASGGGGMSNPMTTAGDIIYGGASGTPTRLAAGTAAQILHSGTTPVWKDTLLYASGVYTPSTSSLSNMSSVTVSTAYYTQIGNIVTVTIGASFTPTAANTATSFIVTLPVTTATTSQSAVGGGAYADNLGSTAYNGAFAQITGANACQIFCRPTSTASGSLSITFMYKTN